MAQRQSGLVRDLVTNISAVLCNASNKQAVIASTSLCSGSICPFFSMRLGHSVSISVAFPQASGKGILPVLPHTK